MRFARALAGMLLLVTGIPALVAGAALGVAARHAEPDGGFRARFEPVETTVHAVLVPDLAELLRRDAPFVRSAPGRLRLTARTADGPAFLGLAPAGEVYEWLGAANNDSVTRIAVTRGALPVQTEGAYFLLPDPPTPDPIGRPFWVREGIGTLEFDPADLGDQQLALVLMRPDGRAGMTLDIQASWRVDGLTQARWALLGGGLLLLLVAGLVLLRPVRPREVVFVVEPEQVPVLAQRLGVTSLSALGGSPGPADAEAAPAPAPAPAPVPAPVPAERALVAVGAPAVGRPTVGRAAADGAVASGPAGSARGAAVPDPAGSADGAVLPGPAVGGTFSPGPTVGGAVLPGPGSRPVTVADLAVGAVAGAGERPAGPAGAGLVWPPLATGPTGAGLVWPPVATGPEGTSPRPRVDRD